MSEKRIDPDDGQKYTFDELKAYYKGKFKPKAIAAYWEDECKPVKGKKGKGMKDEKPEPKAKAKAKGKAKASAKNEKRTEKDAAAAAIKKQIKAFHTAPFAPNPQIVDIFAREKGLDLMPIENQVDLLGAANRNEEHKARNPAGQVPYFELKDGSAIAETIAMCEFVEELMPKPSLIGGTPKERAKTRMLQRRLEEHFVYPSFYAFRFWTASSDCPADSPFKDFFKNRYDVLIPESYKKHGEWAVATLKWLENLKKVPEGSEKKPTKFMCGNKFTVVDIQMWTTIKFFEDKNGLVLDADNYPWTKEWFDRLSTRPSIKACMAHVAGYPIKAVCEVSPGGKPCGGGEEKAPECTGTITFVQTNEDTCRITYKIKGLKEGKHGFHIHELADFSNGCLSAGPHYNPHGKTHGGPKDEERHVGDMGNIEAGKNGVARGKIIDKQIKLTGDFSVIGRSVMVHEDEDDLGTGDNSEPGTNGKTSKTTGNAGARIACGEIKLATGKDKDKKEEE